MINSSKDIASVLCYDCLDVVVEFLGLFSLPIFSLLNKNFRSSIEEDPLYEFCIKEIKDLKSLSIKELLCDPYECGVYRKKVITGSSYLTILREKLREKLILEKKCSLIRADDFLKKIVAIFLKDGDLKDFEIKSENFEILTKVLMQKKTITELNLERCKFLRNIENSQILSEFLKENRTITYLNLSDSEIENPEVLKILSQALIVNQTIKTLDLSGNQFYYDDPENENVKILSELLIENKTITKLDLFYVNISHPEEWKSFCKGLRVNQSIAILDLQANYLGSYDENMHYFSEALKDNKTITELDLSFNAIFNSAKWVVLAQALMVNKTITTLDLSANSFGRNEENIDFFSVALMENKNLTRLDLRHMRFSDPRFSHPEVWKIVCKGLRFNESIAILDLSRNNLGDDVEYIEILSEALMVNKTITILNLSKNNIGLNVENIQILSEALMVNKTITRLDLSSNYLRQDDVDKLRQIRSDLSIEH